MFSMTSLVEAGKGIILVTHHFEEILPEIDRVVLLKQGMRHTSRWAFDLLHEIGHILTDLGDRDGAVIDADESGADGTEEQANRFAGRTRRSDERPAGRTTRSAPPGPPTPSPRCARRPPTDPTAGLSAQVQPSREGNAQVRPKLTSRFRLRERSQVKRALAAVAHSQLVTIWHVLSTQTPYRDLGGDYFLRRDNPEHRRRRALDQLERLGYRVILEPAA